MTPLEVVLKPSQQFSHSLPSQMSRKLLAVWEDFIKLTLRCSSAPLLLIPPHRDVPLHSTRFFFFTHQASRNNDHHPTKPQHQYQSTHQQSLHSTDHILSAQADKTWPGGTMCETLFSGKTHKQPYFSSQDVSTFQIFSSIVACCHIS